MIKLKAVKNMEKEIKILIIDEEQSGNRLDIAISELSKDISRSYAQNLISEGLVYLDNEPPLSKKVKVKIGQEVKIELSKVESEKVLPEKIEIEIVYEDEDLLVVNKPRGMVVHPGNGNYRGTLVNALKYRYGDNLSTINGDIRAGIVHRIDKDTSGLLVVAKNDMAHEALAKQLKDHTVVRKYIGLALDNIKEDDLTIDERVGRDRKNRLRSQINGSNPKEAVTHIHIIERFGRYTLFEARLDTGRTHQIRVHMAYIKHPLVGDTLYGLPMKKQLYKIDGQLLHAKTLGFTHPRNGEYMEFSSEIPSVFSEVIRKLRLANRD